MTHEEARIAISRRLDDDLDSTSLKELEEHLSVCSECRIFAQRLSRSRAIIEDTTGGIAEDLHETIMEEISRTPQPVARRISTAMWSIIFIIFALLAFFLYQIITLGSM